MGYHDGLLSGRNEGGYDDSQTPEFISVEYHPDVALFRHSIGGAIVGTVCLILAILLHCSWLLTAAIVIVAIAGFLFLLWLGIVIAKRIRPEAVKKNPIFRPQIINPGDSDPDSWIYVLFGCTILCLITTFSWNWLQQHAGVQICLLVLILCLVSYLMQNRISYVFGD